MSSKIRRRKTSQDDPRWTDGTQARRAANAGASNYTKREPSSLCCSRSRKGKRAREGNRLPSAFRRRVPFHGRGASKRKDGQRAALASLPRAQQKRGEFSAFRCV